MSSLSRIDPHVTLAVTWEIHQMLDTTLSAYRYPTVWDERLFQSRTIRPQETLTMPVSELDGIVARDGASWTVLLRAYLSQQLPSVNWNKVQFRVLGDEQYNQPKRKDLYVMMPAQVHVTSFMYAEDLLNENVAAKLMLLCG